MEYSQDDVTYTFVDSGNEFNGSDGTMNIINAYFSVPVAARFIKITPSAYLGYPGMTVGLIESSAPSYTEYTVTVSGDPAVFYLDSSANPQIDFSANETYVFDQSDSTNVGQQLVFGYTPDDTANILTSADGVTIMGSPGQTGAYTQIDLSAGFVGPLYYYSDASAGMGFSLIVDISYQFAVQDNALGQPVFAVYDVSDAAWYNQTDLSFVAPNVYQFDLSSSVTDGGYTLVFGTEVDNSGTVVGEPYVTRETGKVILDLRDYSGESLVYFEDSSAGMGYVEVSLTSNNIPIIFSGVTEPKFYWDFRTTTPLTNGSETYVEDIMNVSNTNLKAVAKGSLSFNSLTGPTFNSTDYIHIDPVSFGGKCSVEVYYYVTSFTNWQRVLCFANTTKLSSNRYLILSAFDIGTNFGVSLQNDNSVYESTGSTPTTTSLNTWYQAVVTLDENGSLEAYVNKVDQGYNTTITLPEQQRIYNLVGRANNKSDEGMNGQIGYVRIWQDHVLTTSEISNLYDTRSIPYIIYMGVIPNEVYTVTVSGDPAVFYIGVDENHNSHLPLVIHMFSTNPINPILDNRLSLDLHRMIPQIY